MNEDQQQDQQQKIASSNKATKIIIMLSIIVAAISMYMLLAVELPDKPIAGQGGPEQKADLGGEFILTDHNGNQFKSDRLKGKMSLVYFGFTFCPDICPTSLSKMAKVLDTLDKFNIDVTPVFITVDPSRDKNEVLKEYLGHFNSKIIGLTGSEEEIRAVADKFKVFYARTDDSKNGKNDYMIDHSSFVYLMDKNFEYKKHFYMSSTAEEIIEYIRVNK